MSGEQDFGYAWPFIEDANELCQEIAAADEPKQHVVLCAELAYVLTKAIVCAIHDVRRA